MRPFAGGSRSGTNSKWALWDFPKKLARCPRFTALESHTLKVANGSNCRKPKRARLCFPDAVDRDLLPREVLKSPQIFWGSAGGIAALPNAMNTTRYGTEQLRIADKNVTIDFATTTSLLHKSMQDRFGDSLQELLARYRANYVKLEARAAEAGGLLYAPLEIQNLLESHKNKIQELEAIQRQLASSNIKNSQHSFHVAMPHNFDLDNVVRVCIEHCDNYQGLLIFAMNKQPYQLVRSLCRRIVETLGQEHFAEMSFEPPRVTDRNIRQQVERIRRLAQLVQHTGIALTFDVVDLDATKALLEALTNHFGTWRSTYILVVINTFTDTVLPEKIFTLRDLNWSKYDLFEWIRRVAYGCDIRDYQVVDMWKKVMLQECSLDDEISIDAVYSHIEFISRVLPQNANQVAQFHAMLLERLQRHA